MAENLLFGEEDQKKPSVAMRPDMMNMDTVYGQILTKIYKTSPRY